MLLKKHYKTVKVGISHYANIENKHQKNRKKLVARAKRSECVYKRAAEPSVTFCEEEKQWSGWLIFYRVKNRNKRNLFRRERDFLRRGRTAERATDFLRSKIIGASGACSDESVTFCDIYNRPQMCHRHIWGGKIFFCIQFKGNFFREKVSLKPFKNRFV